MANIETGVDKLIRLVAKEKRIEVGEAAKQLGVSPTVTQEWAEFLEEEGLVGLQYSLSKVFIVEKRLTKIEVEKKGKEYESKKEAFVRRVDSALKQLEDETAGFDAIKKQYDAVKDNLGSEINTVKEEIGHLKHYEELKKNIDKEIQDQKNVYQNALTAIKSKIVEEEKRYGHIVEQVEGETKKLDQQRTEFTDIRKEEQDLTKRIGALQDILKTIQSQIKDQTETIEIHEQRLQTLRELADALHKDLIQKREKELEPMLKISEDQAARITRIQEEILEKIKGKQEVMDRFEKQSKEVADRFETFFAKRSQIEGLIETLDKTKTDMRTELEELIGKAKAFDLAEKNADINSHIKGLDTKFKSFDEKRGIFSKKLESLKELIMHGSPSQKKALVEPIAKHIQKSKETNKNLKNAKKKSAKKPIKKSSAKKKKQ